MSGWKRVVRLLAIVTVACGTPASVGDPSAADTSPQAFAAAVGERFGPDVLLKQAVIYPGYTVVTLQDPEIKHHIDTYYWDGEFDEPDPVDPSEEGAALLATLFGLDEVRWDGIPALVEEVEGILQIEEPTSYVVAWRDSDTDEVRLSVYVTGPRDSDHLEADADANILPGQR